jgi:hypothetical protein
MPPCLQAPADPDEQISRIRFLGHDYAIRSAIQRILHAIACLVILVFVTSSVASSSPQQLVITGVAFPLAGPSDRSSPPSLVLCSTKTADIPSRHTSVVPRMTIPS